MNHLYAIIAIATDPVHVSIASALLFVVLVVRAAFLDLLDRMRATRDRAAMYDVRTIRAHAIRDHAMTAPRAAIHERQNKNPR